MADEIETASIPSDSESVDGLCDSDTEHDQFHHTNLPLAHAGDTRTYERPVDFSDDEDSLQVAENEKWTKHKKPKVNTPFTGNVGPNVPGEIKSPSQIFLYLFTQNLLDLIVDETNRYLKQNKIEGKNISKDELLVFFGINILMGIKKLPSYRDHWSSDAMLNDPYTSSLMTVNRFGFFLSNIHISDNSVEPKKGTSGYDKLYKLRPLLDQLNKSFKNCWKPSKYQSVDESMIKFTGRSSLKQYMPAKPIKRGYKCWVRADESSFVCEFQIYTGKTETTEKQLGPRIVKDLTRELVGKGHHVYFDNFFTGVELMIDLKKDTIFACGTVRSNRSRLPKSEIPDKKMSHGQYEYKTSNTGIRWIRWMDKKPVHFLSNYHDPCEMTTVSRRQKDGSLKCVDCPHMCRDYNEHMGYVDNADHLLSTFKIDRKSHKWWHRIFWHFIDVTVVNSFIIHKERNGNSLTSKKFRLSLVNELVGHKLPTPKGRKRQSTFVGPQKPQVPVEKRRSEASHMPLFTDTRKRCALCSTKTDERRTRWICKICDAPLCLSEKRNCFMEYHI